MSTGAWYNYAIQAVLFGGVLDGPRPGASLRGRGSSPGAAAGDAGRLPLFRPSPSPTPTQISKRRADRLDVVARSATLNRPSRSSSSSIARVTTGSTADSTWSTITGSTRYSSRSAWPSRVRSGWPMRWRPGRFASCDNFRRSGSTALPSRSPSSATTPRSVRALHRLDAPTGRAGVAHGRPSDRTESATLSVNWPS